MCVAVVELTKRKDLGQCNDANLESFLGLGFYMTYFT